MEWIVNTIGYAAAVAGTSIMIPQLVKTLRTKSVGDVSMGDAYCIHGQLFLVGNLWVAHRELANCDK